MLTENFDTDSLAARMKYIPFGVVVLKLDDEIGRSRYNANHIADEHLAEFYRDYAAECYILKQKIVEMFNRENSGIDTGEMGLSY